MSSEAKTQQAWPDYWFTFGGAFWRASRDSVVILEEFYSQQIGGDKVRPRQRDGTCRNHSFRVDVDGTICLRHGQRFAFVFDS